MKKVRLILAAGACLLAGIGVYANSSAALQFYYTSTAGDVSCVNAFTGTVCTAGTVTQCSVVDEGTTVYITQKQESPTTIACHLRMRPAP